MSTPGTSSRRVFRAVSSATALVFLAALLGLLLAATLGGAIYGLAALLHHLASQ